YLAELARPTIGVVTTVAAVHTEFLGSLDGVRVEKASLVRAIPPEGWVALNADDPCVAGMARDAKGRVITYGRALNAQVRAAGDVVEDAAGVTFALEVAGARRDVTLHLAGRHNVTNALAAAAVGSALGFTLDEITHGLAAAHHATTFEDTVAHLLKRLAPGDTLLVKGSRGMRLERVVDALVARLARE